MDEDYDDEDWEAPSRRFGRVDLIVVGLDLLRGITGALNQSLTMAQALAASHANYATDRRDFAEKAALDIETMTAGGLDGERTWGVPEAD